MQGFREIINNLSGPSRGIYLDPNNDFNNVFSGYNNGVQVLAINNLGVGAGLQDFTLTGFTPNDNNLWQFDSEFDGFGTGYQQLLAHPGQNLNDIASDINTPVLGGDILGTTLSPVGVFTLTGTRNGTDTILLSATSLLVGAGQLVTSTSGLIPASTTVVSITGGNTVVLSNPVGAPVVGLTTTNPGSGYTDGSYVGQALTGGTGTLATADITVSGGAVTLVANISGGDGYLVGDVLSAVLAGGGTNFALTVNACTATSDTFTFDNTCEQAPTIYGTVLYNTSSQVVTFGLTGSNCCNNPNYVPYVLGII
jgi:hypothetical protein